MTVVRIEREKAEMTRMARESRGFTLMELLAAVTLMVILGTMLFTVFKNSSQVVSDAQGRQGVLQQAKLFMEHIEAEASGAYWSKQAANSPTKLRPFLVQNNGTRIAMVTAAKVRDTNPQSIDFGTEANLGRVGYFMGDGTTTLTDSSGKSYTSDKNTLYRFEYYTLYGTGDDAAQTNTATPFINDVVGFTVECWDTASQRFNLIAWDSTGTGTYPRALRVTLRLTDDRHLKEYSNMSNDINSDGVVTADEAHDNVGQTFEHVAFLGSRTW